MSHDSLAGSSGRVLSIDALRGFDMFWIVGGDALAQAIFPSSGGPFSRVVHQQFEHAAWEGFRFYDLIFPLFLFLVGCVLPYSLEKYREQPVAVYGRIVRRTLLLVLLGLVSNGLMQFQWEELRVAGVLQRIGICYGIAAILYLHLRPRGQVVAILAVLFGYWLLFLFVPVPGGITGDFSKEGNLAGYVDRNFLPGKILKLYYGYGDNEGLLSTIPAVATTLIGALTGTWLRGSRNAWSTAGGLFAAGVVCLAAGYCWSAVFPIIKNIWTSSFVLFASGWSLLLLGFFYTVIDILGWRRWSFFFVVIGMNAITIYFSQRFIDFQEIAEFFLEGLMKLSGDHHRIILWSGTIAAKWLFLWFLFRHRVFLRV